MKALWLKYAAKIDALNLRERALLFATIVLILGSLADTLAINPLLNEQKKLTAQIEAQAAETRQIREQLQIAASKDDPLIPLRAQLLQARSELQQVEADINTYSATSDDITRLPVLLNRVLQTQQKITLIRAATLTEEDAPAPNASAADTVQRAIQTGTTTIRRRGVDITVTGSYLDLMRYLDTLERTLPTLRWGDMQIKADVSPTQMTIRVYLVTVNT